MQDEMRDDDIFEVWDLYQAIIEHDYMRHRKMIEVLEGFAGENLHVLDLGCGDAYATQRAFRGVRKLRYQGLDQSREALQAAARGLAVTDWSIRLRQRNMVEALPDLRDPFDLIIAGYSLHHLEDARKQSCLNQIHSLLAEGGSLLVYDLMPRNGEDRAAYIQRFLKDAEEHWGLLSDRQHEEVRTHVQSQDIPIDLTTWKAFAGEAGFADVRLLYRDDAAHYGFLQFTR